MLRYAHFAKRSLPKLVAEAVEVLGCDNGLAKLVELVHNHRDDILLVFQEWVGALGGVYLRGVVLVTACLSNLLVRIGLAGCVLPLYLPLNFAIH